MYSQSQPWWRGVEENASKSSSIDLLSGSAMNCGATQSETNKGNDGVDFNKQTQPMVSPSLSAAGGTVGKEYQSTKHVLSSTPPTSGKHLGPNSHMELYSHSIVLTSYPYSDAHYAGILTSHGPQTMITPQLYGMHRARMPLPLDMEEEPVYVNAKQYHGILRRRQSRAKAELEKKLIKVRKPYLHESRHLHAMRRARGCGGRFLNTKKLESNNSVNVTPEKGKNTGANPLAKSGSSRTSECLLPHNENLHSSNDQHDISISMVRNMHKAHGLSIGYDDVNEISSQYHSQLNGKKEGGCSFGPNGAIK